MTPDLDKLEEAAKADIQAALDIAFSAASATARLYGRPEDVDDNLVEQLDAANATVKYRSLRSLTASHRALEVEVKSAHSLIDGITEDRSDQVFDLEARATSAESARDRAEFLLAVMAEFAASNWSDVQELQGHVFLVDGQLRAAEASLAVAKGALEKSEKVVGDLIMSWVDDGEHGGDADEDFCHICETIRDGQTYLQIARQALEAIKAAGGGDG